MGKNKLNVTNFLIWRKGIIEHVRKGKLNLKEYAVFGWICTLASPFTGSLQTSFHTLADDLNTNSEEIRYICRCLKNEQYIWYPLHQGKRAPIIIEINKYLLPDGKYTELSSRFEKFPKSFRSEQGRQNGDGFRSVSEVKGKILKSKQWLSDCTENSSKVRKNKFSEVPNTLCNNKDLLGESPEEIKAKIDQGIIQALKGKIF